MEKSTKSETDGTKIRGKRGQKECSSWIGVSKDERTNDIRKEVRQ